MPRNKSKNLIEHALTNLTIDGLSYHGDYDVEWYKPCENGSDCCDNDYCRCSEVSSTKINSIDIDGIVKKLIGTRYDDPFSAYCIERIIRNSNIKDIDSWEVICHAGYYGEETAGIRISNQLTIDKIYAQISSLSGKNNLEKILHSLENEYGFILDELKDCKNVEIKKIKLEEVFIPNVGYAKKINQKYVDQYELYNFPRAICILENEKYRLIDGYHRFAAAKKFALKNISIVILSK